MRAVALTNSVSMHPSIYICDGVLIQYYIADMAALFGRKSIFLLVACFGAICALALDLNKPLPHFVAKTMDGERITTESVKGKVLLLEFWATWCQPCKSDEPVVEKLTKEF